MCISFGKVLSDAPAGLSYAGHDSATFALTIGNSFTATPTLSSGTTGVTFSVSPMTLPSGSAFY